MNRILKKLVPGVLAAALALGAVPSGITFDDILASADGGSVKIEGLSLTVDSSYGLNCYVSLSDGLSASDVSVVYHTPNAGTDETVVTTEKLPSPTTLDSNTVYKITVPVYPKHYDKTATLQFKNGDTVCDLKYSDNTDVTDDVLSTTVKAYLANIEDNYDKIESGDSADKLYDLAHALKLYGQYTQYYFANKSKTSGTYEKVEWWTKTGAPTTAGWMTNLGITGDMNSWLNNSSSKAPTVSYDPSWTGGTQYQGSVSYSVALVLDEDIKARFYYVNWLETSTPWIQLFKNESQINGSLTSYPDLNDESGHRKYVETSGINIGYLTDEYDFRIHRSYDSGATSYYDHLYVSPVGYAKAIVITLASGDHVTKYEYNGLANAMRAMVVADWAAKQYFGI